MRFSLIAIASAFALAAAQDLSSIPSCAIPCFVAALPGSGCDVTDTKCQCTTGREKIQGSIATCTPTRCSADEVNTVAEAVLKLCSAAGVTITDVPTGSATASASGAPTGASNGTASVTPSGTPSASAPPQQSTNAAAGTVVGMGALAMGILAAL